MRVPKDDPYWDAFIHRAPADPNNAIPYAFKQSQPGGVNPVKTEVHSPNVMAQHVKDLAKFYGADHVGIVALDAPRFGIVCAMRSDYDPATAVGIGGQTPAMKGLFAAFTLGAYIRELGYSAEFVEMDRQRVAAAAGLALGPRTYVADILVTNLPLEADGALA